MDPERRPRKDGPGKMDLKSAQPYRGIRNGVPRVYARRTGPVQCDVLVAGAESLRNTLQGRTHPCAALFGFSRLARG